jgi:2-phosphoglycerate kinase
MALASNIGLLSIMHMLDTKLILVDGIPGSGKSTTAQWIALELQKRNMATINIPTPRHVIQMGVADLCATCCIG